MIPKVTLDAALIVSAVILPVSLIPPIRIYPSWRHGFVAPNWTPLPLQSSVSLFDQPPRA